jgi:predicted nucleic acid-binding protein
MARIDEHSVVVDAGPLIHLDELACLDLLADFSPLIAPDAVWVEVRRHRPHVEHGSIKGLQIVSVIWPFSQQLAVLADTLDLASGETSALAIAERYGLRMLLTDDAAARLAGESLGLRVHGTIGIVVRSIRRGLRSRDKVVEILRTLRERSTLHIAGDLLASVMEAVMADQCT